MTALTTLSISAACAQGAYLRAGLGYAAPMAGAINDIYGTPYSGSAAFTNNGNVYSSYKVKPISFSAGLYLDIAVGHMFSENVGVELGINSLLGPREYSYTATNAYILSVPGNATINQQASIMLFTPSLVLRTRNAPKQLYTRMGITLPVRARIYYEETDVFTGIGPYTGGAGEVNYYNIEYTTSFTPGFSAAAGVNFKVNDQMAIYTEITMLSMSLYIKELKYKEVFINNEPQTTVQTVKFGMSGTNVNPNTGQGTQVTTALPFSNIGIRAGVHYSFTRPAATKKPLPKRR